jgi:hypothetical protein
MLLVQLGILAATKIAMAFHQIVPPFLRPSAEAVEAKVRHRANVVMNKVTSSGNRLARQVQTAIARLVFIRRLG